ncbi:MAG: hypothetical protein AAFO94_11035 [Bacteroidota bacterium]
MRKVKGTLHWVSAAHAINPEVRMYDVLFTEPNPLADEDRDFMDFFNPESLVVNTRAMVEPCLKEMKPGQPLQFIRKGYFTIDTDSTSDQLIVNQTIGMRDTWAKLQNKKG